MVLILEMHRCTEILILMKQPVLVYDPTHLIIPHTLKKKKIFMHFSNDVSQVFECHSVTCLF